MRIIIAPPLPMRLRMHPPSENEYEYVIGLLFETNEGTDKEIEFGYICTNGNEYNDFDYTPECFLDDVWQDWE